MCFRLSSKIAMCLSSVCSWKKSTLSASCNSWLIYEWNDAVTVCPVKCFFYFYWHSILLLTLFMSAFVIDDKSTGWAVHFLMGILFFSTISRIQGCGKFSAKLGRVALDINNCCLQLFIFNCGIFLVMLKDLKIISMLGFIKEANLNKVNTGFEIFANLKHLSHSIL